MVRVYRHKLLRLKLKLGLLQLLLQLGLLLLELHELSRSLCLEHILFKEQLRLRLMRQ